MNVTMLCVNMNEKLIVVYLVIEGLIFIVLAQFCVKSRV